MRAVDLIQKKRDGQELTSSEIEWLVEGYVSGTVPDYQMSAFAMAVYFKGMTTREISDLTMRMVHTGQEFDLSAIDGVKVDKHSTGGVGDKVTLILAPLVASFGVPVAKMSGRGLGHTGGTIDKLESIKGYQVERSQEDFIRQVQSYKQSIEEALGSDNVVVDIQQVSDDELGSMTTLATSNANTDWDINAVSGWNPDFADPSTYLDVFDPTSGPSLLSALGVAPGTDNPVIKTVGLDKYKELIDDANSEKTDLQKRYSKYSKAQAWLSDSALVIPVYSDGAQMLVTKMVPGSGAGGWVGDKTSENSYKYLKIQDKIVTTKEMDEFRKKFADEKAKSNADYQKNLDRHIQD